MFKQKNAVLCINYIKSAADLNFFKSKNKTDQSCKMQKQKQKYAVHQVIYSMDNICMAMFISKLLPQIDRLTAVGQEVDIIRYHNMNQLLT